jgi:hypothetical protein
MPDAFKSQFFGGDSGFVGLGGYVGMGLGGQRRFWGKFQGVGFGSLWLLSNWKLTGLVFNGKNFTTPISTFTNQNTFFDESKSRL